MCASHSSQSSSYELGLVHLDSDRGQQFAARLDDENAAWLTQLLDAFEAQQHGSWCALAVDALILKVLRAENSSDASNATTAPNQEQLLDDALVVTRANKRQLPAGISLQENFELVSGLLDTHARGSASVFKVDSADPALLASALDTDLASRPHSVIIANLLRQVKGSITGHWVVVAGSIRTADDEEWILILDPAAHKLGPHWLPKMLLIAAMATVNHRGELRGYLAVERASDVSPGH